MNPSQNSITLNSNAQIRVQTSRVPTVLIVDDDRSFRTVARLALTKAGYKVLEATDGASALELIQKTAFDAMVIDARMPVMDGFEMCARVQQTLGEMTPPMILSTGLNDDASIQRAFEAGAIDYVTKPLNWRILTGKLNYLIESYATKKSAQQSDQKLRQIINASSGTHLVLDREAVICATHGTESLPTFQHYPFNVGDCLFDVLPAESVNNLLAGWKRMLDTGESGPLMIANHDTQEPFVLELSFVATEPGQAVCLIKDFTGSYLSEQRIYSLAFQDRATGVGNRARLVDWLNQATHLRDAAENSAVVRISLRQFHEQELRIGRSGLDALAAKVAERLLAVAAPDQVQGADAAELDTCVSRIAEDEFAIGVVGSFSTCFLSSFAQDILEALLQGYEIDATVLRLDARIGLADRRCVGADPAELLNCASLAMKLSEAKGGDVIALFDEQSRTQLKQQADLEKFLRRDIEARALHMAYQPKVDADSLQLVGVEALLRWNCEELGPVSPGAFIPLAEQCGLMTELSKLVIEKVLDQLVSWQDSSLESIPVAINISGSHLSASDFVCDLAREIEARAISPHLIELEVTESVMIDSKSCAVANLRKLRDHGIKISVDDFGTGYSSFSYLSSLPVDVLKIDRSFVMSINEDPKSLAIAKAIITVGHELGLQVVAEGVETKDQLLTLRELGCDTIQGYFTGRPVVACDFVKETQAAQIAATY